MERDGERERRDREREGERERGRGRESRGVYLMHSSLCFSG